MPKVKNVEKRIWDIEGFDVEFLKTDGKNVHGGKGDIPQYKWGNALKNNMTVDKWKKTRFLKQYPGFDVAVLDGNGDKAQGQMTLGNLRDTYAEDDD